MCHGVRAKIEPLHPHPTGILAEALFFPADMASRISTIIILYHEDKEPVKNCLIE